MAPPKAEVAASAPKKGAAPAQSPGSPPAGVEKRTATQSPGSPPAGTLSSPTSGKRGSTPAAPNTRQQGGQAAEYVGPRPSLSTKTPNSIPSVLPVPSGAKDMLQPEDAQFRERAATATTADVASAISTLSFMAAGALAEIHRVFNRCDMVKQDPSKKMVREILLARRNNIVLHGVGREGLMMRALTMRLFHLGLHANCLGDMTCPKLGPGDLFIASAGPGTFSSVNALMATAKEAGSKILLITAQPEGEATRLADEVAWLPAQTMKDEDPEAGKLPVDRPWDRYSIPGRPEEKLHAFHRSFVPPSGMVDKNAKEDSKAKAKQSSDKENPKNASKTNNGKKEKEESDSKSTRTPKSPTLKDTGGRSEKDDPKGELGVGALPAKEKVPHYMIPLEGGHIDREIVVACKGDPEYICLLADNKILPMGSVYEGAMYILFEIVTYMLRVKLGETVEGMCERHTNME